MVYYALAYWYMSNVARSVVTAKRDTRTFRRHQTCHFREHATSAPAESRGEIRKVLQHRACTQVLLQARKLHVYGSGTFDDFWHVPCTQHSREHRAASRVATRCTCEWYARARIITRSSRHNRTRKMHAVTHTHTRTETRTHARLCIHSIRTHIACKRVGDNM